MLGQVPRGKIDDEHPKDWRHRCPSRSCLLHPGFSIFIIFLDPPSHLDPVRSVEYLIANETLILSAMTLIYIVAALVLLVLVLALHDRLKTVQPRLMALATPLGIIWAGIVIASGLISVSGSQTVIGLHAVDPERAGTVWLAVGIMQNALGGGIELVGGVWILLVSVSAMAGKTLSRFLNYLGVILGLVGIASVVPALSDLVDVFGLGQIVWFFGSG
ncbi:hypothetical protein [Erythrobacter alti]|uniref:hypothetical protein n=1 Tax=Erythrobacter alti TaxID=1896145 RepID=UPI0030F44EC2